MNIYAKQDTALEQVVKAMHDRIKQGFDEANNMVEKTVGARPISPAFIFHWGTIMKFVPEFTFKPEDEDKIDKKILRPIPKVKNGWKPNLRTKVGNEFRAAFYVLAEEWEVKEDALHEFGIHMTDFKKGVSHYIRPMFDPERKQYFLSCSNSVPEAFDKEELANMYRERLETELASKGHAKTYEQMEQELKRATDDAEYWKKTAGEHCRNNICVNAERKRLRREILKLVPDFDFKPIEDEVDKLYDKKDNPYL